MLRSARENFTLHLDYFKSLDLRALEGSDVRDELTRAMSALDDAKNVYNKTIPRIGAQDSDHSDSAMDAGYPPQYGSETGGKDFVYWLKAGLAFTLPLVLVGVLIFIALISGTTR